MGKISHFHFPVKNNVKTSENIYEITCIIIKARLIYYVCVYCTYMSWRTTASFASTQQAAMLLPHSHKCANSSCLSVPYINNRSQAHRLSIKKPLLWKMMASIQRVNHCKAQWKARGCHPSNYLSVSSAPVGVPGEPNQPKSDAWLVSRHPISFNCTTLQDPVCLKISWTWPSKLTSDPRW